MRAGYDNGQLLLCRGNEWKSYLFIDIREMRKPAEEFHQIITIPAGKYLCGIGEGSDIRSAPRMFPELFAQDYSTRWWWRWSRLRKNIITLTRCLSCDAACRKWFYFRP